MRNVMNTFRYLCVRSIAITLLMSMVSASEVQARHGLAKNVDAKTRAVREPRTGPTGMKNSKWRTRSGNTARESSRAIRPDAIGAPMVVGNDSNCCALIAEVKKCLCQLKNISESQLEILVSVTDLILSKVCRIEVGTVSEIDVLVSITDITLSKVCRIDTQLDLALCAIGSKTDLAFSNPDQFTTLDGINDATISIVSWCKTIMRELRGV